MRREPTRKLKNGRIRHGLYGSDDSLGMVGAFEFEVEGVKVRTISGIGEGWEHVSVSVIGEDRCPTWHEMTLVKLLFWYPSETVVEYHPPFDQYVNDHKFVLHLWKPTDFELPLPSPALVGRCEPEQIRTYELKYRERYERLREAANVRSDAHL